MNTTTEQAAPAPSSSSWVVDASHSTASFTVRHMMITNVRGEFQKVAGTVTWDPARSEFGMTWNNVLEAGGVLVGDDVNLELDVSLVLQK